MHITESFCFSLDLDIYILLRRISQTELPGGGKRESLFFYLDLLNLLCHLRGKLCQQQKHLADKTEVSCKSYRDIFYFCSALICWLVLLSLFQKNDPSGVLNENKDFWIIKFFWSLNRSPL